MRVFLMHMAADSIVQIMSKLHLRRWSISPKQRKKVVDFGAAMNPVSIVRDRR